MSDAFSGLNESQERRLLVTFQYADKLLSEVEAVLSASSSKSPFPKYAADFTPAQERVIRDYVARIRAQMLRAMAGLGIKVPGPQFGAIHSIRVQLSFIRVALQEASPKDLAGYGPLPPELIPELDGFSTELQSLVQSLDTFLAQAPNRDFEQRLERLTVNGDHVVLLKKLERIISRYGFVEFRPTLGNIVDRLATPRFEIAVFGQVSSGKSSLLNAVTGVDVLPVGVNPVTSVPTRLVYGPARALVSFASGQVSAYETSDIVDFVTEERNPANTKGVTRIVVSIPSERLREGVVLVDTPGLGSLATAGAAETRAYLPQCDLGLVLINAGSTVTAEDVQLVRTLYMDGIPAMILLSKCDLALPADRERAARYITVQMEEQLGIDVPVYPVSALAQYREVTERWFAEQLEPLYSRYKELSNQSIKRKISLLRDSVATALAAKNGSAPQRSKATQTELESAEKTLRAAAGRISEAERKCYQLVDDLRELGARVGLDQAASKLVECWSRSNETPCILAIRSGLSEIATEQAGAVHRELQLLARDLGSAFTSVCRILDSDPQPAAEEFGEVLRDLPQIDLSGITGDIRRPIIAALGQQIARKYARSRLRTIAGTVDEAFVSFSRLLQAWMRKALKRINDVFEAYAGAARAQLERLLAANSVPPGVEERLLDDLADIGVEATLETEGAA